MPMPRLWRLRRALLPRRPRAPAPATPEIPAYTMCCSRVALILTDRTVCAVPRSDPLASLLPAPRTQDAPRVLAVALSIPPVFPTPFLPVFTYKWVHDLCQHLFPLPSKYHCHLNSVDVEF